MLKRLIIVLLLAFAAFTGVSGMGDLPDSLNMAKLDKMLDNYVEAISRESLETKMGECDFLINSVSDSLTTQHIALKLYDYYKDSQLMGDEAVAIHIYDTWFKPGTTDRLLFLRRRGARQKDAASSLDGVHQQSGAQSFEIVRLGRNGSQDDGRRGAGIFPYR